MGIFKRGDRWYVRYVYEGAEYRLTAGVGSTAEHAKAMLAGILLEIAHGRHTPGKRRSRLTVRDLCREWLEQAEQSKRSWKRDRVSVAHLNRHLGSRRIDKLSALLIEGYKRDRQRETYRRGKATDDGPPVERPTTPGTINRELTLLRTMLRRALRDGRLIRNPFDGVKLLREPPGRVARLSADDEARVLAACPPRLRALVAVALHTGCRVGELLAARWRDVDLRVGLLAVEQSKSGQRRDVPLNATARAVLEAVAAKAAGEAKHPDPDARVFSTAKGGKYGNVERDWRLARVKAGLPTLRLHDLRHAYASRLVEQGTDLLTVASLLGHGKPEAPSLAMVSRYAHLSPQHRREAVERLAVGAPPPVLDAPDREPDQHKSRHTPLSVVAQTRGKAKGNGK